MSPMKNGVFSILLLGSAMMQLTLEAAHFRNSRFGDNSDQVKAVEKAVLLKSVPGGLVYRDRIFGIDVSVTYQLSVADEILIGGVYEFDPTGYEIEELLDHYMELNAAMDRIYGPVLRDGFMWWNDQTEYRNDPVNAFRFGDLSFRKEWFGPGVHVTLNLSNELNRKGKIVYVITYEPSKDYSLMEDFKKL
jgi:hypothetical protein